MKLAASVIKTVKENLRDWKVLVLVLVFAPFFLFLMYLFFSGAPATYRLGVLNRDGGNLSAALTGALAALEAQDGAAPVRITYYEDIAVLQKDVRERSVDLGVVIPADYSDKLLQYTPGGGGDAAIARVDFYGSLGNPNYAVAAALAWDQVSRQGLEAVKLTLPSEVRETFLEKKQSLGGFDAYVPGGIALAVLMILFSACASIVKENDKKTLLRLKLSKLGAFNFLCGISIVQVVIGTAAIALSYWTALALGYSPAGGFGPVLLAGVFSSISIVAVSLLAASFLSTMFDVLTVGCFPFFIMMFFSGSMFPLPRLTLFTLFGRQVGVTDLLPLTHTVSAFNKVLGSGEGVAGIAYELAALTVLSALYMAAGMALYGRRRLSKA
jgi:ABC-2 type transport system permease protein